MKYRLTQNKPHCDISSFHCLIVFLIVKRTLWTPCSLYLASVARCIIGRSVLIVVYNKSQNFNCKLKFFLAWFVVKDCK